MNEDVALGEFYVLGDVDIDITIPGYGTQTMNLNTPNNSKPFSLRITPIQDSKYNDGKANYRKGYTEYRLKLTYSYKSHYMALNKLMASTSCNIQFPMPFSFLNQFDFVFDNDSVEKNFVGNLPVTKKTKSRYFGVENYDQEDRKYYDLRDANPVPDGEVDLEFTSVKAFTAQEIANLLWHEPVVEPPEISIWYGDPSTLNSKTGINDGSLKVIDQNQESASLSFVVDFASYFYVELKFGGFIDRLFRVSNDEDSTYNEIGESSDGNTVWKVEKQRTNNQYQIQTRKGGDLSNIIDILIKYAFLTSLYEYAEYSTGDVVFTISGGVVLEGSIEFAFGGDSISIPLLGDDDGVIMSAKVKSATENDSSFPFVIDPQNEIATAKEYGSQYNGEITFTGGGTNVFFPSIQTSGGALTSGLSGYADSEEVPLSTIVDEDNNVTSQYFDIKRRVFIVVPNDQLPSQYNLEWGTGDSFPNVLNSFDVIASGNNTILSTVIPVYQEYVNFRVRNTANGETGRIVYIKANYALDLYFSTDEVVGVEDTTITADSFSLNSNGDIDYLEYEFKQLVQLVSNITVNDINDLDGIDIQWSTDNFVSDINTIDKNEALLEDGKTLVYIPNYGEATQIRFSESGSIGGSKLVEVLAQYPLNVFIFTDPITGEEDSNQVPISTTTETDGDLTGVEYDFKNYIYLKTNRSDLSTSNLEARWKLDDGFDTFSNNNSIEIEVLDEADDLIKFRIPVYIESFIVELIDNNVSHASRSLEVTSKWANLSFSSSDMSIYDFSSSLGDTAFNFQSDMSIYGFDAKLGYLTFNSQSLINYDTQV